MKRSLADVFVAVLVVAGLFILVRPGSPGVAFISNLTAAITATVKTAADLGSNQS